MENKFSAKLGKAIREANAIVKGVPKPPERVAEKPAPVAAVYTVYSILEGREKAIGFNLNAIDADQVISWARRKLIKSGARSEDGKSLFEITEFEARKNV